MKLLLLLTSITLFACSSPAWKDEFKDAKSLVIQFNSADSLPGKMMEAADLTAVNQIAHYVTGKAAEAKPACKDDGRIVFSAADSSKKEVRFYLQPSCRYFSFPQGGKTVYSAMSDEAFDFLEALRTGKTTY